MSTQRVTWKDRLDPFAHLYADMDSRIEALVAAMTDDELRKTLAATKRPTQSNAWWATYGVAPLVATAVNGEVWRRKLAKKAARAASKGEA